MSTTPETTTITPQKTTVTEATVTEETTTDALKNFIQVKSLSNTTKVTGKFLETGELGNFRISGKFAYFPCELDMEERKKLSEGLLHPVFNADPEKVAEYFLQPHAKKEMVLAKTCYREGYHSKKQDKFFVFRNWKSVSALQAAALCLDKFLVIKLLSYIVGNDTLRLEAKKQLEEIRNRIVKENTAKETKVKENVVKENVVRETKEKQETVNSATKVTSVSSEKVISVSTEKVTNASSEKVTCASSEKVTNESSEKITCASSEANDSSKGDRKEVHENVAYTACADLSEYGAPIQALLEAYSKYITHYRSLSSQESQEKLDKKNKLWDVVGSCHKRLPRYVLQEIFDDMCWDDYSDFAVEPPRVLRYGAGDNDLLDLDDLGDGTLVGLYKGPTVGGGVRSYALPAEWVACDSAAISHLYELRLVDLENIIDALKTPESAVTLIASGKSMGLKQS